MSNYSNLQPGIPTPKSGTYKCVYCGPDGLAAMFAKSTGISTPKSKMLSNQETVMYFEEGEELPPCKHCGDATGWNLLEEGNPNNLRHEKPVSLKGVCDNCNKDIYSPNGYLLTSSDVLSSPRAWKDYYEVHEARLRSQGIFSFGAFANNIGVAVSRIQDRTPWLICDDCIGLFDVDPSETKVYAQTFWDSNREFVPPGNGMALPTSIKVWPRNTCRAHTILQGHDLEIPTDQGYLFSYKYIKHLGIESKKMEAFRKVPESGDIDLEIYFRQNSVYEPVAPWLICKSCAESLGIGNKELDKGHDAAIAWWKGNSFSGYIPESFGQRIYPAKMLILGNGFTPSAEQLEKMLGVWGYVFFPKFNLDTEAKRKNFFDAVLVTGHQRAKEIITKFPTDASNQIHKDLPGHAISNIMFVPDPGKDLAVVAVWTPEDAEYIKSLIGDQISICEGGKRNIESQNNTTVLPNKRPASTADKQNRPAQQKIVQKTKNHQNRYYYSLFYVVLGQILGSVIARYLFTFSGDNFVPKMFLGLGVVPAIGLIVALRTWDFKLNLPKASLLLVFWGFSVFVPWISGALMAIGIILATGIQKTPLSFMRNSKTIFFGLTLLYLIAALGLATLNLPSGLLNTLNVTLYLISGIIIFKKN